MGSAASVFGSRDGDEDGVNKEQVQDIAGDRYDEEEFRRVSGGKNYISVGEFKQYLLALETKEETKCTVTAEDAREMVGDLFDEMEFRRCANSNGCMTMNGLKKYLLLLEDPKDIILNFAAIKGLWFASDGGRGRGLVDIKDTVRTCQKTFKKLFMRFASDPNSMEVSEFHAMIIKSGCGLDENVINSHFFECTKFPDDEDDVSEVSKIRADVGKFISAIIRVANAVDFQNNGMSDKSLRDSLLEWLVASAATLEITADDLADCKDIRGLRDRAFFDVPPEFVGTKPRVYLEFLGVGSSDVHTVKIELDAELVPRTAYNFKCLCTGERGFGEVTGLPLNLEGSSIHRIVAGMCVQGGDIEGSDGFGGESIYGGCFDDENFSIKHDAPGIISMGNQGPNTNTSQYFITLAPSPHLDGENVAFGRVVEGMDYINTLGAASVDEDNRPLQQIVIKKCGVISQH